jgi:predicted Zn-dependent protease
MNTIRRLLLVLLVGLAAGACARVRAPDRAQSQASLPSAAVLFERGMQLAQRGDALRAEQYLVLALRAGHPHELVIVPLVRVCIASARLRSALAHAQPFLRSHPQAWQLRYLVAAIQLALGRPGEALIELSRILAQRPHAAQAHYLLGVVRRDALQDPVAARASFEAYLRQEPRGPHASEVTAWLAEQSRPAAAASAP